MSLNSLGKSLIQKKGLWLSFINKWNVENTFNIIKVQDLDDILQTAYLKFLKRPVYYYDDINIEYFKKVLNSVYIDTYRKKINNKYVSLEKSLRHIDKLFYYNDYRNIDWKGQQTRNKILFSISTKKMKKQEDRYKNVLLKIKKLNKEDSLFLDYVMENNFNITKISKLLDINYYSVYRRYKSIINFLRTNYSSKTTIYETKNNRDIDRQLKSNFFTLYNWLINLFSIMDKRKFNGGKREGAGRKPKSEESKLIEKLSPLEPLAFAALKKGLEKGDFKYVQLYYNYVEGKPKETKDIHINEDVPLFID